MPEDDPSVILARLASSAIACSADDVDVNPHGEITALLRRRDALISELLKIKAEIEAIWDKQSDAFHLHGVKARTMNILRTGVFELDDDPDLTDIKNARRIADLGRLRLRRIPNCGQQTIADIERYLKTHGLKLTR